MKAAECIITQAGMPLALVPITGKRGTALLPGTPIAIFKNRRRARTAVARTLRIAKQLRGSLLDGWPKIKPLFNGGAYKIEPTAKS